MVSSTNNKSNQSETFAPLYGVLLYKKKDIIAIQEKLGINSNTLKQIEHEPDGKTLADSYELLLHLVGDLIPIQDIGYNNVENQNNRGSSDLSLSKLFNSLLCLEKWQKPIKMRE